ncbi:MAG: phosphate signaling complex protein PhoU [Ruthenibacterium sp.]
MNARISFDAELEALSASLITMGALATDAIAKAMEALQSGNVDLAHTVMAGDAKIDEMERTIEHQCLTLLLRQQPVASDLRKISTAIKMITDVERVGDAAADIAEISTYAGVAGIPDALSDITKMAHAAQEMVNDAIGAYVSENLALAAAVIARDDVVDDYFNKIKMDLAGYIAADSAKIDCAIDYLMITKYLERLGDHAVNICEWVQFYKTGIHKSEKIL